MIFPLIGVILGAFIGLIHAKSKGADRLSLVHWAAVHAMVGGILGFFVLIGVERSYL